MSLGENYSELTTRLGRIHTIYTVADLLVWDEQVNLPADGADLRAGQLAAMAELQNAETANARLGELIGLLEADAASLDDAQRAVLRQARKDHDRAARLPPEFVRDKAEHNSRAYHAWADARPKSDFTHFAPFLEKHLSLARREAEYLGW
ncbi:MAG: carboxypeptidase M32, partial [Opitutaceae bacterium]